MAGAGLSTTEDRQTEIISEDLIEPTLTGTPAEIAKQIVSFYLCPPQLKEDREALEEIVTTLVTPLDGQSPEVIRKLANILGDLDFYIQSQLQRQEYYDFPGLEGLADSLALCRPEEVGLILDHVSSFVSAVETEQSEAFFSWVLKTWLETHDPPCSAGTVKSILKAAQRLCAYVPISADPIRADDLACALCYIINAAGPGLQARDIVPIGRTLFVGLRASMSEEACDTEVFDSYSKLAACAGKLSIKRLVTLHCEFLRKMKDLYGIDAFYAHGVLEKLVELEDGSPMVGPPSRAGTRIESHIQLLDALAEQARGHAPALFTLLHAALPGRKQTIEKLPKLARTLRPYVRYIEASDRSSQDGLHELISGVAASGSEQAWKDLKLISSRIGLSADGLAKVLQMAKDEDGTRLLLRGLASRTKTHPDLYSVMERLLFIDITGEPEEVLGLLDTLQENPSADLSYDHCDASRPRVSALVLTAAVQAMDGLESRQARALLFNLRYMTSAFAETFDAQLSPRMIAALCGKGAGELPHEIYLRRNGVETFALDGIALSAALRGLEEAWPAGAKPEERCQREILPFVWKLAAAAPVLPLDQTCEAVHRALEKIPEWHKRAFMFLLPHALKAAVSQSSQVEDALPEAILTTRTFLLARPEALSLTPHEVDRFLDEVLFRGATSAWTAYERLSAFLDIKRSLPFSERNALAPAIGVLGLPFVRGEDNTDSASILQAISRVAQKVRAIAADSESGDQALDRLAFAALTGTYGEAFKEFEESIAAFPARFARCRETDFGEPLLACANVSFECRLAEPPILCRGPDGSEVRSNGVQLRGIHNPFHTPSSGLREIITAELARRLEVPQSELLNGQGGESSPMPFMPKCCRTRTQRVKYFA